MANDKLVASQASGGAHHRLGLLVGKWEGTSRTWFEPGELADESPIRGTIRTVLDGASSFMSTKAVWAASRCRA